MKKMCLSLLLLLLSLSSHAAEKTLNIGIVVYDGLTISEVTAPVEVFASQKDHPQSFRVVLIAQTLAPITAHEGLKVVPDVTFDKAPELDVLIVPGSYNDAASRENPAVISYIQKAARKARFVASHCAGAFVLGTAGLLDGHKVTTYYGGGSLLQKTFPKVKVQDAELHYVVDGNLITSNGGLISYEASLVLLHKLAPEVQVKEVADRIYYNRLLDQPKTSCY